MLKKSWKKLIMGEGVGNTNLMCIIKIYTILSKVKFLERKER